MGGETLRPRRGAFGSRPSGGESTCAPPASCPRSGIAIQRPTCWWTKTSQDSPDFAASPCKISRSAGYRQVFRTLKESLDV